MSCVSTFLPETVRLGDHQQEDGEQDREQGGEQGGEEGGEEGEQAKLDKTHLAQVQPHSETKAERGRHSDFGKSRRE